MNKVMQKEKSKVRFLHIAFLYWVYPEFCVNILRECKQQKLV